MPRTLGPGPASEARRRRRDGPRRGTARSSRCSRCSCCGSRPPAPQQRASKSSSTSVAPSYSARWREALEVTRRRRRASAGTTAGCRARSADTELSAFWRNTMRSARIVIVALRDDHVSGEVTDLGLVVDVARVRRVVDRLALVGSFGAQRRARRRRRRRSARARTGAKSGWVHRSPGEGLRLDRAAHLGFELERLDALSRTRPVRGLFHAPPRSSPACRSARDPAWDHVQELGRERDPGLVRQPAGPPRAWRARCLEIGVLRGRRRRARASIRPGTRAGRAGRPGTADLELGRLPSSGKCRARDADSVCVGRPSASSSTARTPSANRSGSWRPLPSRPGPGSRTCESSQ